MKLIETTLQDAVTRCKTEGGYFYRNEGSAESLTVIDGWKIVARDTKRRVYIDVPDFDAIWIYVHSPKSTFQEWNENKDWRCHESLPVQNSHLDNLVKCSRKEGWNAAIESILNLEIRTYGDNTMFLMEAILPDQVKKLIEP